MSKSLNVAVIVIAAALCTAAAVADSTPRYGFGQVPTAAQIEGWDIDVNGLTGKGLPSGHGSVAQGEEIFAAKCASCHGDFGEGNGRMPVLAGGRGSLNKATPLQTVGSYWPYAPSLFDYIKRAMPFTAPQTLSNDDVYALTAYILNLNDVVPKNAVLDAKSLAAIKMPNRNGFYKDPRPDVHNVACMHNCKPAGIKVTGDASKFNVTPDEKGDSDADIASFTAAANAVAPQTVSFSQVQGIVVQRCAGCHSAKPTQAGFSAAPAGVMLDTPEQIRAAAQKIDQQAVRSQAMPIGNITKMTPEERAILGQWIAGGAK